MRILSLGDRAVTVEFASGFDKNARAAVVAMDQAIARARSMGALIGVVDVAPTFRSLTIHYDPMRVTRSSLERELLALKTEGIAKDRSQQRLWRLPVLYGGHFGPDLSDIASAAGISEVKAIELHSDTEVSVHMLGFLPGFAFMGDIAAPLRRARRKEPRLRVPPGSVAVADRLTAVYPWESPGGWHLIGVCPLNLFDTHADPPAVLAPGDRVRFEPVSETKLRELQAAIGAGDITASDFRMRS